MSNLRAAHIGLVECNNCRNLHLVCLDERNEVFAEFPFSEEELLSFIKNAQAWLYERATQKL